MGDHLRKRRLDLGLRQCDLARRIGVRTSTFNTWENNHFAPSVRFMPTITALLGYDPSPRPPTTFGAQLKAARIAAGLTRRQLAEELGVHPGTIAEWERGEAQPSSALGARAEEFLGHPQASTPK